MKENEQILLDTWDTIKCSNIGIMGVLEEEEGEKEGEKIFKAIIAQTPPKDEIHKSMHPRISVNSKQINTKRSTPRHTVIRFFKR